MKIKNEWVDLGDKFDGSTITLSHDEFNVLRKVFTSLSVSKLRELGLSEEEINTAIKFSHLY